MDSFEMNKIIGAILGTILFVMGVGFIAEAIYAPKEAETIGYALPMPEGDGHGGGETVVAEAAVPLGVLLASATADDGAKVAKKCASCHNFEQGGANKTGPGLYGVVERPIASHEGFSYSTALTDAAATYKTWTYEHLNDFLTSPKAFAPGTKMTFAGLRSEKDRANLLAYLQSLSDTPVPFPAAEAAPAAAPQTSDAAPAAAAPADAMTPAAPAMENPMTAPAPAH